MSDLRRRAQLGLTAATVGVAAGVVAGFYRCRHPEEGTVAAYAGPDALYELADEILQEAARLGTAPSQPTAAEHWPDWSDRS